MIAKKNPKADLEKKRFAFFQIGLIVSGSLCLAAFEYSTGSAEMAEEYNFEPYTETLPVEPIYEPIEQPKSVNPPKVIDLRNDIKVVKDPVVIADPIVSDPLSKVIITEPDPGETGDDFGFVEPLEPIIDFAEVEPAFPGGMGEMARFINDNIELPNYIPDYDQGTVYVQFVVNKDGSIEQVDVVRGLSSELNRAAKKVVKSMPKWVPGEQAGKPVRVRFTLPIQITLN